MLFKRGTYVGTGSAWSPLTGHPYAVAYLQIRSAGSDQAVHRFKTMVGDATLALTTGGTLTNRITSLNSDGFSVGTDAQVNTLGVTYYYWLLGEDSDVAVVSYTGNNTDNTDITSPGLDPNLVLIGRSDSSQVAVFRTSAHTGDDSSRFASQANLAGAIKSFVTGGFRLGTSALTNAAGGTYHALVAKHRAGSFITFTYVGDGVDNKNINTLGLDPETVVTKRDGTSEACLRTSDMVGDSTPIYSAAAWAANRIQSMITGGFQIGTAAFVNNAASNYYGWAFKEQPAAQFAASISCTATVAGSLTTSISLQATLSITATLQGSLGSLAVQPVLPSCVWTVPAQNRTFVVPPVPTYVVR